MTHPVLFGLMAPTLVGLGFVFLAIESGRPFRSRYLLHRLQSAWISRETLAFAFFVLPMVLDHFFPNPVFKIWAALSAIVFMAAQGFIIYSARAVPAWNVSIMPFYFLSSGFASGAGVALLLVASAKLPIEGGLVLLSMICAIWNLIVWLFYLRWSSAIDFRSAIKTLRRPLVILFTIPLGHLLPLLLLLLLQSGTYTEMEGRLPYILIAASGLAMIVGVVAQKSAVLLAAGYTRKIALRS